MVRCQGISVDVSNGATEAANFVRYKIILLSTLGFDIIHLCNLITVTLTLSISVFLGLIGMVMQIPKRYLHLAQFLRALMSQKQKLLWKQKHRICKEAYKHRRDHLSDNFF